MLHELIEQIASIGGEAALGSLFVISVVSVAIIGERAWFFMRRRLDVDRLAQQLLQPLRTCNWLSARAIAERSSSSICFVALAGLAQIERGSHAMRAAFRSSMSREKMRLEGQVGMLRSLGDAALLVGVLGTLFDLIELTGRPSLDALVQSSNAPPISVESLVVLAPAAAGLLVAIPAWLAARILRSHVRRVMQQIEFITQLILSQIAVSSQRTPKPLASFSTQAA